MSDLTIGCMPYSFEGSMFEFSDMDEFKTQWQDLYDRKGTEEYSLDFIDGTDIEYRILKAMRLNAVGEAEPKDLQLFFEILEEDKIKTDRQALAFEILMDHFRMKPSINALRFIDEVCLFEGTAEDYAFEYWHECFDMEQLPIDLFHCIDWRKAAHELESSGAIVVYRKEGFVLANPHSVEC